MLYLGIDRNLVAARSLSVTADSDLVVVQFPRFLAICRSRSLTVADVHAAIPHTRVNDYRHCCFGTMVQYCFRYMSLGLNLATFLYIGLPLILNYISIPMLLDKCDFYCTYTVN